MKPDVWLLLNLSVPRLLRFLPPPVAWMEPWQSTVRAKLRRFFFLPHIQQEQRGNKINKKAKALCSHRKAVACTKCSQLKKKKRKEKSICLTGQSSIKKNFLKKKKKKRLTKKRKKKKEKEKGKKRKRKGMR
ncbi:hypothetical protein llap_7732 [Limosa lapponica baueri]|uniref:Uncharacterized protein n=1 Tax=Limosa lapponica baueri TaxID=1758121 RepID=A0A2I0U7A2_LIMLA|nr:hypothetical protein llap_7732 [Limosa lapponica baueri]